MKSTVYLLCFAFLCLLSCGSDSTAKENTATDPATSASGSQETPSNISAAAINYKDLADAYCKCAINTVSVNNKLKSLMDANETAAFEAMLPEADKAFKDAMECCKNAKFEQSTAEVDQQKLFKPLKKTCPDLPQQLMLKMVTEIK